MLHRICFRSRPEASLKADQCRFCSCFIQIQAPSTRVLHDETLDEIRKFFFHADCSMCVISPEEPLCQVCRHMRLGHFIRCFDSYTELHAKCRRYSESDFAIRLGSVRDLQKRAKECALCQQFCNSVGRSVKSDYEVILEITKKSNSDPLFGAELVFEDSQHSDDERVPLTQYNADRFYPLHEPDVWVVEPCSMNLTTASNPDLVQRPNAEVDWEQINTLLASCQNNHYRYCRAIRSANHQIPGFRVIDVERKAVVLAPAGCKYAALSYVWGPKSNADMEATISNIKDLEEKGFPSQPPLPATIRDAMTVCLKIGMPYLWVDRLCILQDATTEKQIQINSMDIIYSNAAITIVMLTGNHVHHGLSGISGSNRATPSVFATQGIYVAPTPISFARAVQNSPWNDRGWTFQEGILSQRLLFFSEYGVFYECASSVADEVKTLRKRNGVGARLFDVPNGMYWTFHRYKTLVEGYTKRNFSVQSDILRAVTGVLNSGFDHHHFFGLPWKYFCRALMWTTTDGHYLPREAPTGDIFPSWSWSSVVGQIEFQYLLSRETKVEAPIALWAYVSTDRLGRAEFHTLPLFPAPVMPDNWNRPYSKGLALGVVRAWTAGCFTGQLPDVLKSTFTWKGHYDIMQLIWDSLTSLLHDAHGKTEIQHGALSNFQGGSLSSAEIQEVSRPGRVLAYTQSVQVQITPLMGGYMKLQDTHGRLVGCLLPKSFDQSHVSHLRFQNPSRYYDLLAISIFVVSSADFSRNPLCESGLTSEKDAIWYDLRGLDPVQGSLLPGSFQIHYVTLILLETVGGVRKRLGLGMALLKTWTEAYPRHGYFVLS